jgi:hypothetical protein
LNFKRSNKSELQKRHKNGVSALKSTFLVLSQESFLYLLPKELLLRQWKHGTERDCSPFGMIALKTVLN